MRIQLSQGCDHSGISHTFHINGVDIMLLHFLKYEIQLAPAIIITVELPFLIYLS